MKHYFVVTTEYKNGAETKTSSLITTPSIARWVLKMHPGVFVECYEEMTPEEFKECLILTDELTNAKPKEPHAETKLPQS